MAVPAFQKEFIDLPLSPVPGTRSEAKPDPLKILQQIFKLPTEKTKNFNSKVDNRTPLYDRVRFKLKLRLTGPTQYQALRPKRPFVQYRLIIFIIF